MRRRVSNRPIWNPSADAAAESQLLSGLVTFRRRAAKPGLLNTPAATLDLDFARQLQSLRLLNSDPLREENPPGSSEASKNLDSNDEFTTISTDLLVTAADGQLEQSLRWQQQRQRQQRQQQQHQHLTLSLPLLGGRLNYFLRGAVDSPTPDPSASPPVAARSVKQPGRLAYRTSLPGAEGVSPDEEIALLLRSRSPTRVKIEQRQLLSPADASSKTLKTQSTFEIEKPPIQPSNSPTVSMEPRPVASASTGTIDQGDYKGRLFVRGELAISADAQAQDKKQKDGEKQRESPEANDFSENMQNRKRRDVPKKSLRNHRGKVNEQHMLSSIDAKPQKPPQTAHQTPQTPQPALNGRTAESEAPEIPIATVISRQKRKVQKQPVEPYALDRESHNPERHRDASFSRTCSCLSHSDQNPSQQFVDQGFHQPGNIIPSEKISHPEHRPAQMEPTAKQSQNPVPDSTQRVERQETHQNQLEALHLAEVASTELQRRPVPDQYRTAHRLAKAASQDAQFSAWLQAGREPADFFSCRTSPNGYYSYFHRLPRYDRGLQPFAEFPPTQSQASQPVSGSKRGAKTPAMLAYGGKNPDNYLPPPIMVRVRRPLENRRAKPTRISALEELETSRY
ncbi:hypothetical protein BOX15_Mlig007355g1 [Macrostomum lignano]|uniref:Uncharacterized protein n=1 Tax=Macrostomum lignano TaxID=282301 RepID=A0A267ELM3_9PLAT|nr:hypothetical protein BOX15_Mlig007355g1 [Macrostomum lignano]